MTRRSLRIAAALLLTLAAGAAEAGAQMTFSVGGGIAQPMGDFGDEVEQGITGRAQLGLSLLLAGAHAQVGFTRFPGINTRENRTFFHAGVGGRVGVGLFFVGANALYFSGDDSDGVGYVPEVGLSLLKIEVVADGRIDGDAKWVGLRAALKF